MICKKREGRVRQRPGGIGKRDGEGRKLTSLRSVRWEERRADRRAVVSECLGLSTSTSPQGYLDVREDRTEGKDGGQRRSVARVQER